MVKSLIMPIFLGVLQPPSTSRAPIAPDFDIPHMHGTLTISPVKKRKVGCLIGSKNKKKTKECLGLKWAKKRSFKAHMGLSMEEGPGMEVGFVVADVDPSSRSSVVEEVDLAFSGSDSGTGVNSPRIIWF